MAFTRKFLEGLEIPDTAIQAIIDEHVSVTSKINDELKQAKSELGTVQKELDDLKGGDWENKYQADHTELEALRSDVAAKETKAKKEAALKAYYEGKNVKGTNLKIAMRGTDFDCVELDEDGKIKDTKALDELLKGDFAGLVENKSRVVDTGAHIGDNKGGEVVDYNLKNALKAAYKRD